MTLLPPLQTRGPWMRLFLHYLSPSWSTPSLGFNLLCFLFSRPQGPIACPNFRVALPVGRIPHAAPSLGQPGTRLSSLSSVNPFEECWGGGISSKVDKKDRAAGAALFPKNKKLVFLKDPWSCTTGMHEWKRWHTPPTLCVSLTFLYVHVQGQSLWAHATGSLSRTHTRPNRWEGGKGWRREERVLIDWWAWS